MIGHLKANIARNLLGKISIISPTIMKRSEFPNPRERRLSSYREEQRIPIFGYENDLVPWKRPAIWSIQEKGKAIEVRQKR